MNYTYQYAYLSGSDAVFTNWLDGKIQTDLRYRPAIEYVLAQKSGYSNDDWLEKLESGIPVGSPYLRIAHMSISSYPRVSYMLTGQASDDARQRHVGYGTWYLTSGYVDGAPDSKLTQRAATMAAFNYYVELDKSAGSFEGMTFIGEFPKLVATLTFRLNALHNGAIVAGRRFNNRLRRLQRRYRGTLTDRDKVKLRTSLSGYYLEYWFGIYPLAMSIAGLQDAFSQPPSVKVQGRAKVIKRSVPRTVVLSHNSNAQVLVDVYRKEVFSCEYTGFYSSALFDDLDLRLGFTTDDIALAAWELVPFSWAVDYWGRIGEYLTSRKYAKFDPVLCFKSERYECFQSIQSVRTKVLQPGFTASGSSVDKRARCRSTRLTRSVVQAPVLKFSSVMDWNLLKGGPSLQQQSYLAAVSAVLTKRMRHLTKLL